MEVFDAAELWSRDQIEHTQLTRLKATVAHVRKSEFYRRRLDEAGVTPESITSLDDILHHQAGSAGPVSHGAPVRTAQRDRAHALLQWYHGQSCGHLPYAERHQ